MLVPELASTWPSWPSHPALARQCTAWPSACQPAGYRGRTGVLRHHFAPRTSRPDVLQHLPRPVGLVLAVAQGDQAQRPQENLPEMVDLNRGRGLHQVTVMHNPERPGENGRGGAIVGRRRQTMR